MRRRIFLAVLLAGGIASAQPASRAETLFQEGRTLMKEGRLEEACAKLGESHKLEPAPGTLLNLARCHEEQGKLATALKEYRDVRDRARTEGRPDRQAAADDRIVDLEAKVNRLTIVVPKEAQMPSLVLTLDGATVEASAFGTLLPVDRGAHQILATVDGRERFRQTVVLERAGESRVVELVLSNPQPAKHEPASPGAKSETPTLTYVLGGVGIASLLVAGGFGIRALSLKSDLDACKPSCTEDRIDSMRTTLITFDIAAAVGVVALGAAAVIYLTRDPRDARARLDARP